MSRVAARHLPSRTLLALLPLVTACQQGTGPLTASSLIVVQGNRQVAAAGTALPIPIVVRVLADDGTPVEGAPVGFAVHLGNGTVEPATALSDANGEAKTRWTLGANQNAHELLSSVPGVEPTTILATGIVPSDLLVAQGNNQVAKAGTGLPVQIVLRVLGNQNTPIPGVPVTLQVMSGGGSLNPASAVTNASGEVTVRWTLGNQLGVQNIQATALNLSPLTLSATGT
jgi:hypothetical protein